MHLGQNDFSVCLRVCKKASFILMLFGPAKQKTIGNVSFENNKSDKMCNADQILCNVFFLFDLQNRLTKEGIVRAFGRTFLSILNNFW